MTHFSFLEMHTDNSTNCTLLGPLDCDSFYKWIPLNRWPACHLIRGIAILFTVLFFNFFYQSSLYFMSVPSVVLHIAERQVKPECDSVATATPRCTLQRSIWCRHSWLSKIFWIYSSELFYCAFTTPKFHCIFFSIG